MAECKQIASYAECQAALRAFREAVPVRHSSLYWLPDALSESIAAGKLWLCAGETALLLLRDEGTHYACALEAAQRFAWPLPPQPKPVVCELVYTEKRPLDANLTECLAQAGLTLLRTTLHFTSRLELPSDPPEAVRPASQADLPALCALLAACFDPRLDFLPDEAELQSALAQGDLLVLPFEGTVAGFAYAPVTRHRGTLRHIAVAEAYRGQGLSRLLMQAALAHFTACEAKTAELWSGSENRTAHHLYQRFGFAPDGRRADEYTL